jgi:hypothetical protein
MTITLAFHPRHIGDVRSKDKRLTARVNWERDTRQGESIRFIDSSNNEIFGYARVMQIYDMPIPDFIETEWQYHRNYADRWEFNKAFGEYYPDIDLDEIDVITIIEWDDMFRENRVYDFG